MNHPKTWLQDALIPPEPDGHFVMIPLTRGKFAIVDEADAEMILDRGKWRAIKGPKTYYAVRSDGPPGPDLRQFAMHAVILGCKGGDHANRNGLDNRRVNLRVATASQNQANRGLFSNNKSGYKGVHWNRNRGKWLAVIKVNGTRRHLGIFADPVDAARAYNRAALEAWGEFAWVNPLPEDVTEPPAA